MIKGKGVAIQDSLQTERRGLKGDVTEVRVTGKNTDGDRILSCQSQNTRKKVIA